MTTPPGAWKEHNGLMAAKDKPPRGKGKKDPTKGLFPPRPRPVKDSAAAKAQGFLDKVLGRGKKD
jgi:hypothetical protein